MNASLYTGFKPLGTAFLHHFHCQLVFSFFFFSLPSIFFLQTIFAVFALIATFYFSGDHGQTRQKK
jgi:hypothetical protein